MWNAGYYSCAKGGCVDPNADDAAFLEALLLRELPARLPIDTARVYWSGYSMGGMMTQALLCTSPRFAASVTAVALVSTALGVEYGAHECAARVRQVEGARWFHRTLVDADLAINSMMWQNAGKAGLDQWNFTLLPTSRAQARPLQVLGF